MLAWTDLVLHHDASYPLNDLSQFDADPMGPLARALRGGPAIRYSAFEILVRAVEDCWRQPIRTQLAHIQARLTPDDLPGHAALLRTAEQAAYDVVVRIRLLKAKRGDDLPALFCAIQPNYSFEVPVQVSWLH